MTFQTALFLLAVGVFGGAWNAVAGGATLFTFPALMAAGLPPLAANATNYLALLPANAAALPAYRAELKAAGSALRPLLIVSGLGAAAGSALLTVSDPDLFIELVPLLILLATGLFAYGDALRRRLTSLAGAERSQVYVHIGLFVCSIYGGYFGAGIGIILLGIVQLAGFSSFAMANALKNLLATAFTLISIAIFGVGGLIAWPEALVMMAGSVVGGYLGGRYAKRVNERVLRAAVIVFGLVLAAVYLQRNLVG
ncbi:sulfite exporter TauE/SafE family protein [Oricola sp.]|uniref:sulfite exporter TauE/SafE family protein n=1 Tax=Oricola sp. TaxID=1979950 RepID=UPI0025CE1A79|nr:sulfite exporter TauE/SafE family protein [Oricola sp.]MCI5076710.1 sulfite exporter TauE/SafE family protein [Oricola sp.]